MKRIIIALAALFAANVGIQAAGKYDNPDTLVVARDGT